MRGGVVKSLSTRDINRHRILGPNGIGDHTCGAFKVPSPIDQQPLRVIASAGLGWDHVSVSRAKRCPNWPEMDFVRRMFFDDDETVMQLHVPPSENISIHDFCLHLWRPQYDEIPRPPAFMVGPVENMEAEIARYEAELVAAGRDTGL